MASQYVLQILEKDSGQLAATWAPGGAEAEVLDRLSKRITAKLLAHIQAEPIPHWTDGLPAEDAFLEALCVSIAAKGVGLGRTTAHVLEDVRAAFGEQVHDLKRTVKPPTVS